ncbi:hypothetical protein N825_08630 [Skermanella stibiiresistens SB22]|uniref:Uncharacterized protein n=1 Tax=Skermanella stibiiresistens SB22 TaxID=1385369 RepID=W9H5M4_9PROT|nr:hypothetical protein [Skermanella stibiiresistens]EWY39058.1 hypothetical protein N825_08630 [Skermanella stibiiresistens SB22]
MTNIEPNLMALPWFCVPLAIGCVAFLTLAGMLPLSSRPDAARGRGSGLLILSNSALLLALAAGTALHALTELRWTTVVVVGGVILLFSPLLFQIWPAAWRDNRTGLGLLAMVQAITLAALPLTSIS